MSLILKKTDYRYLCVLQSPAEYTVCTDEVVAIVFTLSLKGILMGLDRQSYLRQNYAAGLWS